jgi:tRNA-2-methylthio-N6-dimethylallyladenosine synthase
LINKRENTFFVETFGCQMNVNDSEKVAGLLRAEGYVPVGEPAQADVVFINTCAVREGAAEKLYHSLGRLRQLKAQNPHLVLSVGGCVAQLQGRRVLERAPHVDILVGTHNFSRVTELIRRAQEGRAPAVDLDRGADAFSVPFAAVAHTSTVRAYVTAMEGCNHVCSFCVVPRTRGLEVNRPPEQIVAEVESLVDRGFSEVTLLGQTVNAYQHGDVDFAELLARVDAVDGLHRIRFTTSHPGHVSTRLADALRDLPSVCPYLHLPVQSGSDRILSHMRRGYCRQEYLDTVGLLRDRVPGLALSSDVIVGYPGESERDFEQTLDLVEAVGFEGVFVFGYSPRPGTSAFRAPDDVPEAEKRRRVTLLNDRQQQAQAERNRGWVGSRVEVLVDRVGEGGRVSGRTPHFRIVHLEGSEALLGQVVEVQITGAGANSLSGRPCGRVSPALADANNSLTASSGDPIL